MESFYFKAKVYVMTLYNYIYFLILTTVYSAANKNEYCTNKKEPKICYSVDDKKEVAPKRTCTRRADKVAHELYFDEATEKKFYLGFFGQLNWCEAHRFCDSQGMHLITIKDSRISDALVKILSSYGGHDVKIWVDVYKNPMSNSWIVSEGNKKPKAISRPNEQGEDSGWLTWAVVDQWHVLVDKDSLPKQFFESSKLYNTMYQSNWTDSGIKAEHWPVSKVKKPSGQNFNNEVSKIIAQMPEDEENFTDIWSNFNFSSIVHEPIVVLEGPIDQMISFADSGSDDIVLENLEEVGSSNENAHIDTQTELYPPKLFINNEGQDLNCASVGIVNQEMNVQAEGCNSNNYFICQEN